MALFLGVSTATVYAIIDRGELRCIRIGNVIRIDETNLVGWLHEKETTT